MGNTNDALAYPMLTSESSELYVDYAARNLADSWVFPARAMGKRAGCCADWWAADVDSPHPLLNSATLLRPLAASDWARTIAELDRFYGAGSNSPWALWSAWPTPDLSPFGLIPAGHPPLMLRAPNCPLPETPPELTIREVTTAAALAEFEWTFVEGFPTPELQPFHTGDLFTPRVLGGRYRLWVGYIHEQPVTCAVSWTSTGVVGIYYVATLPQARRRGYGAAITLTATQAEPALPAVLQASDLGRPVYERIGFVTIAQMSLWIKPRS